MTFKLGDKVTAPCTIVRRHTVYGTAHQRQYGRAWGLANCPVSVTGIFIGYRTYSNGIVHRDDHGNYFEPQTYIKVALIVTDPRKKPVPVLYSTMVPFSEPSNYNDDKLNPCAEVVLPRSSFVDGGHGRYAGKGYK